MIKIWLISQSWFWSLRAELKKISFFFERNAYKGRVQVFKASENTKILGAFTWLTLKSFLWVAIALLLLGGLENYIRGNADFLKPLTLDEKKFNIEQLRLYAQLLTAIFSIYFATIGIILSAGYTRLRRDIINLLTTEQVGSVYSQILVMSAIFCLSASALPLLGVEPGLFDYIAGTALTIIGSLALFPLGQRLFNFFNLNQLARSELLPRIVRNIEGAANPKNSITLSNHHSKAAKLAFEQLCYIDDRMKLERVGLGDNLPALNDDYTALLLHYLHQKHRIDHQSYWFPRERKHNQWFLAGDTATSMALQTSSQLNFEERINYHWLETMIVERLLGHIELALEVCDLTLALDLIGRFSSRISTYAEQFHFDIGMQELNKMKDLIEKAIASSNFDTTDINHVAKIGIADSWATLGSNLCFETLRRMLTFEVELKKFFDDDVWTTKSLQTLPAFLQVDLAFIIERIDFEERIEGKRLSKPKYVQQLAVRKLLLRYEKILPEICEFYESKVPDFISSLAKMKMPECSTQVLLASLHNYWKLPKWFEDISSLIKRYENYSHYSDKQYIFPSISIHDLVKRLDQKRNEAIEMLGSYDAIGHVFAAEHNEDLPDHFGQIYFELAEECVHALEENDDDKFNKIAPMFISLSVLAANIKFANPKLDVNDEYRFHLFSTVFNDLASILGFAILYGSYFGNPNLSTRALEKFNYFIDAVQDKQQYLKRMILLSDPFNFSHAVSPRDMIRTKWKMAFEHRARTDGFGETMGVRRGAQHKEKIVREFIRSHSDASHLFYAMQILPLLDSVDFDINYHITDLASRLGNEECE
ncbi:hypothetical protein QEU86_RS05270 [Enterobacter hormaechei]